MYQWMALLRYTIVSGDKTADFSIGENSGVLRVNRQLDFERKNAYQLTIQVYYTLMSYGHSWARNENSYSPRPSNH